MLQLLSKLNIFSKKNKSPSMSDEILTTSNSNDSLSNDETQTTSAITPSTPPITPSTPPITPTTTTTATTTTSALDQTNLFMQTYEYAKNNYNWHKVSSVISDHPEWLTRIPEGRRWTILHQVVFFGNVSHLNEVLAYQMPNEDFRLLCKTLDDKTVREVAAERAHVHPQMLRHIERLVAIDQVLHNSRDNKWELVRQFLRQQPDIVNEKPPYRKFYLIHYLASIGNLDIFKDLSTICQFKLNLIADNKTVNEIARENNHIEFAEYIENLQANINETIENDNQNAATGNDSSILHTTTAPSYSQGFYDDPGIMIFSINQNTLGSMYLSQDGLLQFPSHYHHHSYPSNASHYTPPYPLQDQLPTAMSVITTDSQQNSIDEETEYENKKKSEQNVQSIMTDEEQFEYEKTVMENIKKFSSENLLNAITCCITKTILRDPVVAADGFTYEREAIVNWFKDSNRSPMTNQELDSKELKPNHAVKSILQSFCDSKKHEKKSDEKLQKKNTNNPE
ncbi:unnamed protein product [Rotaria sordida]|uniref:U-box domain-containing protein n=3 Tax=Rotaria sordida TaxID=392033 RepID=A0A814DH67_9BILA|nr:unnamed protein product [Rotaria sordida]CAF0957045.1 unnamed protein product [Rotaria sordida]